MKSVSLTAFRDSMGSYIKQVHAAGRPILVTCGDPRSNIVVMSARDLAQTREGKLQIHELVEVESD